MNQVDLGARIAHEARKLVGTPFHWHGRIPGVGLDCVGVITESFKAAGIQFNDVTRYGRREHIEVFQRELGKWCDRLSGHDAIRAGDVLVIEITEDEAHAGIWTGSTLIHADGRPTTRAVVEQPLPSGWEEKIAFAFRVK